MANWIIQADVAAGQVGHQSTLPCWNVDDSTLWKPRWAPEQRSPGTYDRAQWASLWPSSSFGGANAALLNQNYGSVDASRGFEPESVGLPGNQSGAFTTPIAVPAQWQLMRLEMKPRKEARA